MAQHCHAVGIALPYMTFHLWGKCLNSDFKARLSRSLISVCAAHGSNCDDFAAFFYACICMCMCSRACECDLCVCVCVCVMCVCCVSVSCAFVFIP